MHIHEREQFQGTAMDARVKRVHADWSIQTCRRTQVKQALLDRPKKMDGSWGTEPSKILNVRSEGLAIESGGICRDREDTPTTQRKDYTDQP